MAKRGKPKTRIVTTRRRSAAPRALPAKVADSLDLARCEQFLLHSARLPTRPIDDWLALFRRTVYWVRANPQYNPTKCVLITTTAASGTRVRVSPVADVLTVSAFSHHRMVAKPRSMTARALGTVRSNSVIEYRRGCSGVSFTHHRLVQHGVAIGSPEAGHTGHLRRPMSADQAFLEWAVVPAVIRESGIQ